jgi:cytoskeletal protein CcmA (bactofilin family)
MFERKSSKTKQPPPAPVKNEVEPSKPVTPTTPTTRTTAMIGSTVKILGEIISDENLIIEGEVEGTITLKDNELTVGPSGRIHANVNAKNIKIDGMVDGDIVAKEKVIISKSGNVRGNVVAPRVILEDGGRFKGSIDMGPAVGAAGELPLGNDSASLNKAARAPEQQKMAEINPAIKRA